MTVRCCQLVLQAVRQPGLLGSAEPGLAVTDWGLGGSQSLWTPVVELRDGARALGESELWCPGESTFGKDPPCGAISVTVGGMEMLTHWCVLGSSLPPHFLLRTQEPALLAPKLWLSSLIRVCQDFSLRFNL